MKIMGETAAALAQKYRNGDLSPSAVVDDCLQRIDRLNPQLHAFIRVFHESARAAAARAAADFARGVDRGPLQGIPIAIKDLATTLEAASSAGTVFLQDYLGPKDAELVALLRSQGAVIIGKTTMTEGAFSVHHPAIAAPVNPWKPGFWTGVSSSGSGVAVAAGLVPLALGSDTGGSIRFPSACNRLVGHMPTFGAVSVEGCFPLAPSLDHMGPMARAVHDCEQMYRVMARVPPAAVAPPLRFRLGIDRARLERTCTQEVQHLLAQVMDEYRSLGFELVDIGLPAEQSELASGWIQTVAAETARVHDPYKATHGADYGPVFAFVLDLGEQVKPAALAAIDGACLRFAAAVDNALVAVDAMLCPVMPAPALSNAAMAARAPDPAEIARSLEYTAPFDYSGHPALTLPAGFIDGVPSGYQLVGGKGADLTLFEVARRHEALHHWADLFPPITTTS
jgi:amidase